MFLSFHLHGGWEGASSLGPAQSTIVSEGFKGGTRGAPIMPRDAVSRTANVERNGGHKWVNLFLVGICKVIQNFQEASRLPVDLLSLKGQRWKTLFLWIISAKKRVY